jgi:predicted DCC family thiol-disulfide oxidoreductase YuxK
MTAQSTKEPSQPFDIEVYFDGGCPLCLREVNLLKRWDRKQRIRFTDIDAEIFSSANVGKTYDELMDQMHGRLPDGTWVHGVEVFRKMYAAVGFGPLVWLSRAPGISQILDLGYHVFARNRLRLTGRCTDACKVKGVSVQTPNKKPIVQTSDGLR